MLGFDVCVERLARHIFVSVGKLLSAVVIFEISHTLSGISCREWKNQKLVSRCVLVGVNEVALALSADEAA